MAPGCPSDSTPRRVTIVPLLGVTTARPGCPSAVLPGGSRGSEWVTCGERAEARSVQLAVSHPQARGSNPVRPKCASHLGMIRVRSRMGERGRLRD
eukprot:6884767-Pyramimonas_sp.AAC.1